jgi:hypothetical protein
MRVGSRLETAAACGVLVLALFLHYRFLWPHVATADHDFDALHLYFPLAQGLAEQGLGFFLDERSIQAPPFAYVYPLLFGRDLDTLKHANALLSGLTLLLVFRSAWLLHSLRAGVAAALLFALSPLMRPYLAAAITEAPYVLLMAAWFWGLAEWHAGRGRAFLAVSVTCLCLASLTRATSFYLVPLLTLAFAFAGWRNSGPSRAHWRDAAIAHAAALLLPIAFCVKNEIVFGFAFFTTGGGNALYLGNSPVTGGYDPNYLGLLYDVGGIARDMSHLSLAAERLLSGVAKMVILEQPWGDLAAQHLRKLGAFVFVTSAEPGAATLRTWRVALVLLAGAGALAVRRGAMGRVLLATLAYQVLVHVPVLYTHRYSVGAIDEWLFALAGIGIAATALGGARRILATAAVVVLAIVTGRELIGAMGLPQPDVFRAARVRTWSAPPSLVQFGPGRASFDVAVEGGREFVPWANYVLVLDAHAAPGSSLERCGPLEPSYRPRGDATLHSGVPRRLSDAEGRYQWGAGPLALKTEGTLHLAMHCPEPERVAIEGLRVYMAAGSVDYHDRYLHEKPLFDYEREDAPVR